MSFDDIRAGADEILHTADDIFLNSLAGVKFFILGLESQVAVTDANGNFHFEAVPAGNIKLAIDGRTATNAPAGIYFPEMVMDLTLRAGGGQHSDGNDGNAGSTTGECRSIRTFTCHDCASSILRGHQRNRDHDLIRCPRECTWSHGRAAFAIDDFRAARQGHRPRRSAAGRRASRHQHGSTGVGPRHAPAGAVATHVSTSPFKRPASTASRRRCR